MVYLIFEIKTLGTDYRANISDSEACMQLKNKKLYTSTRAKGEKGEALQAASSSKSHPTDTSKARVSQKISGQKTKLFLFTLQKSTKST